MTAGTFHFWIIACVLYKCNHISAPGSGNYPVHGFILILSSQKHLYFIPIASFLQLFRGRNRYKFIIHVYSATIYVSRRLQRSLPIFPVPDRQTPLPFYVNPCHLYDFTLFSHTTQYFDTFFHYPINRNRTASLKQNILFHT